MNASIAQPHHVRVLNLTHIDLPGDNVLRIDPDHPDTAVQNIRRYADLPFVFVVSKAKAGQASELLSALEAIRSPCFPYALFLLDDTAFDGQGRDLDIVQVGSTDPEVILGQIRRYVRDRFTFDKDKLRVQNHTPLPAQVDVAIVGAGITGLFAANRLMEAGISFCIVEKRDIVGGIWSEYANTTSQVNSSECAYRLFHKEPRSNRDHSYTREILEDISQLTQKVKNALYLNTDVERIEKKADGYAVRIQQAGKISTLQSKGVILAINDRVGAPNDIEWKNRELYKGIVVPGISDGAGAVDWRDKNVVIVGMGAFAVENARTALEAGARHVTVVCRRHGTICPKIIDYLNFASPYDEQYAHDKKSNIRNMMYWKKLYQLSGATQPECWMGKVKHDGHTISVSDIWFVGHFLKKIKTVTGEISAMTETGVVVGAGQHIDADVVVKCVGFERNASQLEALSGYDEMYNNNYVDKDFMYLADAHIDDDAFNSMFGSSVLEMVKFYMEVFIRFFDNPDYDAMMKCEGIEKIETGSRKWSHYIQAAMTLIRDYPRIREAAARQVADRTEKFHQIHDLETYIAANKREWVDMHSLLAGRQMKEEECLPYVFDRLLPDKA